MIGSSDGTQYETDYDVAIGRPVGAPTEPAGALKTSGGTLPTPVDQKAIDELVAAAPNFANNPVIDQMTATAERSRPDLPISGVAQAPAQKSLLDYFFGSKTEEKPPIDMKRYQEELDKLMPPSKTYLPPDNTSFPGDDEAEAAIKADYAYAKPYEKFFNNEAARVMGMHATTYPVVKDKKGNLQYDRTKPQEGQFLPGSAGGMTTSDVIEAIDNPRFSKLVDDLKDKKYDAVRPDIENAFAKASLAVNRSAIAELGFDPAKTLVDLNKMDGISGATASTGDYRMYVNSLREDPSTIVHESIHNGFRKLLDKNPDLQEKIRKTGMSPYRLEEYMVRAIMYNTMGNPEMPEGYVRLMKEQGKMDLLKKNEGYQQIESGKALLKNPELKSVLDAFEKAAQDQIGKSGKKAR